MDRPIWGDMVRGVVLMPENISTIYETHSEKYLFFSVYMETSAQDRNREFLSWES